MTNLKCNEIYIYLIEIEGLHELHQLYDSLLLTAGAEEAFPDMTVFQESCPLEKSLIYLLAVRRSILMISLERSTTP